MPLRRLIAASVAFALAALPVRPLSAEPVVPTQEDPFQDRGDLVDPGQMERSQESGASDLRHQSTLQQTLANQAPQPEGEGAAPPAVGERRPDGSIVGDLTGDGVIAALDILRLIDYLNEFAPGPAAENHLPFDLDQDGFIVPLDVLLLINHISVHGTTQPSAVSGASATSSSPVGPTDSYPASVNFVNVGPSPEILTLTAEIRPVGQTGGQPVALTQPVVVPPGAATVEVEIPLSQLPAGLAAGPYVVALSVQDPAGFNRGSVSGLPLEVEAGSPDFHFDPTDAGITVNPDSLLVDIFKPITNRGSAAGLARLVAAIRAEGSDPNDPASFRRFETELVEIPAFAHSGSGWTNSGLRYLRIEIPDLSPGRYLLSVWAEDEAGNRIGEPLTDRLTEVHGVALGIDLSQVLITHQVQPGEPVVIDAPITNRGDQTGMARLVAFVEPEGSDPQDDTSDVRRFQTDLLDIPPAGQSAGSFNGIRHLRLEIEGLQPGRYRVSASAEDPNGIVIGGQILWDQPLEVEAATSPVPAEVISSPVIPQEIGRNAPLMFELEVRNPGADQRLAVNLAFADPRDASRTHTASFTTQTIPAGQTSVVPVLFQGSQLPNDLPAAWEVGVTVLDEAGRTIFQEERSLVIGSTDPVDFLFPTTPTYTEQIPVDGTFQATWTLDNRYGGRFAIPLAAIFTPVGTNQSAVFQTGLMMVQQGVNTFTVELTAQQLLAKGIGPGSYTAAFFLEDAIGYDPLHFSFPIRRGHFGKPFQIGEFRLEVSPSPTRPIPIEVSDQGPLSFDLVLANTGDVGDTLYVELTLTDPEDETNTHSSVVAGLPSPAGQTVTVPVQFTAQQLAAAGPGVWTRSVAVFNGRDEKIFQSFGLLAIGSQARAEVETRVSGFFNDILGRVPTPVEMDNTVNRLLSGTTVETVVNELRALPEARTFAEARVTGFFNDIVGRAPSAVELDGYAARLLGGASVTTIVRELRALPESLTFAQTRVTGFFSDILGRSPTTSELSDYAGRLLGGIPVTAIVTELRAFPEARLFAETRAAGFFNDILGRVPTAAELDSFAGRLRAGAKVVDLVAELRALPEARIYAETRVTGFFNDILGRAPTSAELSHYAGRLLSGASTVTEIVTELRAFPEAQTFAETRVIGFFKDILGRDPSAAELADYSGRLRSGASSVKEITDQLRAFPEAQTFAENRVKGFFNDILGRDPSAAELADYAGRLKAGTSSVVEITNQLRALPEAKTFAETRIIGFFRDIVGRDPTAAELADFSERLLSGTATVGELVTELRARPEARLFSESRVTGFFSDILGRAPTPAELSHYVGRTLSGATVTEIVTELRALPEARVFAQTRITNFFNEILGRAPTSVESDNYTNRLLGGTTAVANIVAEIRALPEARAFAEARVTDFFADILGRVPTQEELSHYAGRLAAGTVTVSNLVAELRALPEARTFAETRVTGFFNDILGRNPSPEELNNFSGRLAAGTVTVAELVEEIRNLGDAQAAAESRVRGFFSEILGRVPTPAELDSYAGRLVAGTATVADLVAELRTLPEARTFADTRVTGFFNEIIGRAPMPAELDHYAGRLAAGTVAVPDLVAELRALPEARTFAETRVTGFFNDLLARNPTPDELNQYAGYLVRGEKSVAEVVELIRALGGNPAPGLVDRPAYPERITENQDLVVEWNLRNPGSTGDVTLLLVLTRLGTGHSVEQPRRVPLPAGGGVIEVVYTAQELTDAGIVPGEYLVSFVVFDAKGNRVGESFANDRLLGRGEPKTNLISLPEYNPQVVQGKGIETRWLLGNTGPVTGTVTVTIAVTRPGSPTVEFTRNVRVSPGGAPTPVTLTDSQLADAAITTGLYTISFVATDEGDNRIGEFLGQSLEILPAGSPLSFLIGQQQATGEARGLLETWEVPAGDPLEVGLADRAFSYDQAIAAMALLMEGRTDAARRILEALERLEAGTGRLGFAYKTGPLGADVPAVFTGTNAWVGTALVTYETLTGDTRFRAMAQRIADNLLSFQDPATGLLRGGSDADGNPFPWISTEHNLDALDFLEDLAIVTGEPRYQQAVQAIGQGINTHLWDSSHFRQGYNDDLVVLDTQALGGILYAAGLSFPDPGRAGILRDYIEAVFKKTVDVSGVPVTGYAPYREDAFVWTEGTLFVGLHQLFLGDAASAQAILDQMESFRAPSGGLLYSSSTARTATPGSDTLFPSYPHVVSTAWAVVLKAFLEADQSSGAGETSSAAGSRGAEGESSSPQSSAVSMSSSLTVAPVAASVVSQSASSSGSATAQPNVISPTSRRTWLAIAPGLFRLDLLSSGDSGERAASWDSFYLSLLDFLFG